MPWMHRRALEAIEICRTPRAGGQVVRCSDCGDESYVWGSCRNRACTRCAGHKAEEWLAARRAELLPVRHFHVVFTVPEELRRVFRKGQGPVYSALMRAATSTLMEVAADPNQLGGEIGILAVLHTWTRTLEYHPHVHCLVPAGYVDSHDVWHEVDSPWLVAHEILAKVFRAKLCALLRTVVPGLQLPGSIFHIPWVVHVERPLHGHEVVLEYLARYVHRGPISDSRLVSMDAESVQLKYRDKTRRGWKVMKLKGREFLRRMLQHVLPKGFHRVRYYGLWSRRRRPRLLALRAELRARTPEVATASRRAPRRECRCPSCDSNNLGIVAFFRRGETPPTLKRPNSPVPTVPPGTPMRPSDYHALTAKWARPDPPPALAQSP